MPAIWLEHLLGRARHHVLHVGAAGAGEGDQHVGHRHVDLRLFLARRDQHGEDAEQQRDQRQQRRQRVGLEGARQAAGDAQRGVVGCRCVHVARLSSPRGRRAPAGRRAPGRAATRSPAASGRPAPRRGRRGRRRARTARSTKPLGLRDVDGGQLAAAQHGLRRARSGAVRRPCGAAAPEAHAHRLARARGRCAVGRQVQAPLDGLRHRVGGGQQFARAPA